MMTPVPKIKPMAWNSGAALQGEQENRGTQNADRRRRKFGEIRTGEDGDMRTARGAKFGIGGLGVE